MANGLAATATNPFLSGLSGLFNVGASIIKAPLKIFTGPAVTATKPLLQSTIMASAVNTTRPAIQSQAPSLFEGTVRALKNIFVPKPPPTPVQSVGVLDRTFSSLSDVFLGTSGDPGGGLVGGFLRQKFEPKPQEPTTIFVPPAQQPLPPNTGVTILGRESQPSGMFSLAFPPPPESRTDIRITPPAPGKTIFQVLGGPGQEFSRTGTKSPSANLLLWLFLALLAIVALIAIRRGK